MPTIREELLEATGMKPKKTELDAELIKRLAPKIEGLEDSEWENLSTEAQEFYNSVVEAARVHSNGEVLKLSDDDVPAFPDEDDGEVKDDEDDNEDDGKPEEDDEDSESDDESGEDEATEEESKGEEVMEKKTKPATKKKVAEKDKLAKKIKVAAKVATVKGNGTGKKTLSMRRRLKQLLIKKPALGVDELIAKLEGEGFKATPMTVGSIRSDTRDTMKVLVEAGLLNIQL